MHEFLLALFSGIGGAVLAIAANWMLPSKTKIEQPLEIALRRDFVTRDEFERGIASLTKNVGSDIRRLHDKIESDQRATSTKLEGIGTMIGRLEGKIDKL